MKFETDVIGVSYSVTMLNADSPGAGRANYWMDFPKSPLSMPSALGRGTSEILTIKPGMSVAGAFHEIAPSKSRNFVPIARTDVEITEPALMLHSPARGVVLHNDESTGEQFSYTAGKAILQYADRFDFTREHMASKANEFYTLILTRSNLFELIGEGGAIRLLDQLKLLNGSRVQCLEVPPNISVVLNTSLDTSVSNSYRKLYVSGKILEYFGLLSDFTVGSDSVPISTKMQRIVRNLHEELICNVGAPPNLNALARKYGVSARTLNDYFQKEYADTIFSFMRKKRLDYALELLMQTDLPIKVIANETGYRHVNNFMSAFKQQFGCSAGMMRR